MDWLRFTMDRLRNLPRWLRDWIEKLMKAVPSIQSRLQEENEAALAGLEKELKPYRERFISFSQLPEEGMEKEAILTEMERMAAMITSRARSRTVCGRLRSKSRA